MNLADLELFVRTADSGSISAAARELDVSPAAASAAIKRVEKQLDTQLLVRSTRKLRLTDAGERYLSHCRRALAELQQAGQALHTGKGEVAGTLRLSVSSDFGRNMLLPWLDRFMDRYPRLKLRMSVSDSLSDFYRDRVDIALRYGEPEDSSLIAFRIVETERVLCASPEYLRQHGIPRHPEQLKQHNCLFYLLGERTHDQWRFTDNRNNQPLKISVQGNRVCDDADIVRRWAVAGKGIALKSRLDMARDLRAGRVVELLTDYRQEPATLWLICPSRQQVTPAVLEFRDMLREQCTALLAEDA